MRRAPPLVAALALLAAAAPATDGGSQADGQCSAGAAACDAAGPEGRDSAVPRWRPLHASGGNLTELLGCSADPRADPADVATFCAATQPAGAQCGFLGGPPAPPERRAACIAACLFDTPDLNIFEVGASAAAASLEEAVAVVAPMPGAGAYQAVPFLDRRSLPAAQGACQYALRGGDLGQLATIAGAPKAWPRAGERTHFIFHISHTGSTLLSRALGEVPGTFVLREPPLLKRLALWHGRQGGKKLLSLWRSVLLPYLSRRYDPEHTVIVKGTSVALRFLRTALRADPGSRAVFMYCGLRTHLTIVLARKSDLKTEQPELYDKLEASPSSLKKYKVGSAAFKGLSTAQQIALSWLRRVLFGLSAAKKGLSGGGRVFPLLMEDFLDDPAGRLVEVSAFLGLALERAAADAVAAGPVFRQYAKEFATPWNATVQRQMMKGRASVYGAEIEEGVAFARRLVDGDEALEGLRALLNQ